MEKPKKIVVIGAGPAGLTAAYLLNKAGHNVNLFEASSTVGGLCKTIQLWGRKVDLGPHRYFSKEQRVNNLWVELLNDDFELIERKTRILYNNKFFKYPLEPINSLLKLGFLNSLLATFSFLKSNLFPKKSSEDTFEKWVTSKFGKYLYTVFFKNYSEKLWGLKGHELDADFARQRIKKISFTGVVKNALFGSEKESFVSQFAYPKLGTQVPYQRMAKILENENSLYLNKPIKRVLLTDHKISGVEFFDGTVEKAEIVISTMPITMLLSGLENVPQEIKSAADKLGFRNTILVYLLIEGDSHFPDQWIYIHDADLRVGRITNFNNWSKDLRGPGNQTILCLEYWTSDGEVFWDMTELEIIELAKLELEKTNLIHGSKILDAKIIKLPKTYPIYIKGYQDLLMQIFDFLNSIGGLYAIGRYGAFQYNNQDGSILMGIHLADWINSEANSPMAYFQNQGLEYLEDGKF